MEDQEFTYTYTINGNLSTKTSKITGERIEYSWDNENKLVQVVVKQGDGSIKRSILYKYDGLNRRTQKIVNGKGTSFAYDNEDIVIEFSDVGGIEAIYLHGPGIDEPLAMLRDVNGDGEFAESELFFYAKDHLNSVHALTDKIGKPVQRYNYSAYGKTKVEKTNPSMKFAKNPYAYTSREWEEETGDYYHRARYRNPYFGWLTEDLVGYESGDSNLYRYVENNPIKYSDPNGDKYYDPYAQECRDQIHSDVNTCTNTCDQASDFGFGIAAAGCVASGPGYAQCVSAIKLIEKVTDGFTKAACQYGTAQRINKRCGPFR